MNQLAVEEIQRALIHLSEAQHILESKKTETVYYRMMLTFNIHDLETLLNHED